MKKEENKAPMLDPKIKKEQDINEPDNSKKPRVTPDPADQPKKDDPEDVPESNDPAGYGDSGNVKKGPFKKED